MRKTALINGEYYHIYNRGVDKRNIFKDHIDINRFFQSMILFNCIEPIGSIYEKTRSKNNKKNDSKFFGDQVAKNEKLVEIVSYCLNPNHFHFILRQCAEDGISKFMKRLGGGYSWYFNNRYDRSGSLFQGPFKSIHIDSNEYLLHLSAYVNLNDKVHKFGDQVAKFVRSSWGEYIQENKKQNPNERICSTGIILDQFGSINEYKLFVKSSLKEILKQKEKNKEISRMLLE